MGMKKKLPGRKRQQKAISTAAVLLQDLRPEISMALREPGEFFAARQDRLDAKVERRDLMAKAAGAVASLNPKAALCLYAKAIALSPKGKNTRTLRELQQGAARARKAVEAADAQRRRARNKLLAERAHERAQARKAQAVIDVAAPKAG